MISSKINKTKRRPMKNCLSKNKRAFEKTFWVEKTLLRAFLATKKLKKWAEKGIEMMGTTMTMIVAMKSVLGIQERN